jgi:hypothetical protein
MSFYTFELLVWCFVLIRTRQGSVIPPNAVAGETLHQGGMFSQGTNQVSVQLTAFTMVQTAGTTANTLLTYQPAVTSTKIGATVPSNGFDYHDNLGFGVYFEFHRNTFTIQRCGVSGERLSVNPPHH